METPAKAPERRGARVRRLGHVMAAFLACSFVAVYALSIFQLEGWRTY